jgi:LysR family transcriptional regulator, low CO2-responsive transcriptional regulator
VDLHQLRLFQALAKTGNFSKAAELSHISQPALWLHIKHLEDELGIALVDRMPRGIQLTEAGELVLNCAQQMFASADDLQAAVSDLLGLKKGKLVLGSSTTPGIYLLPEALGAFKKKNPSIELDLRIGNTQQVEDWVLSSEVALGIIGQQPHHEQLTSGPYVKDTLQVIVPPQHRWAKQKSVSVKNLLEEPFLTREIGSNTRVTIENAFRKHGISVNYAMELGSTEAIKRAVAANLGISIVSPYTIQWEIARKQLIALKLREPGFERQFNIIYYTRRRLSLPASAFLSSLQSA